VTLDFKQTNLFIDYALKVKITKQCDKNKEEQASHKINRMTNEKEKLNPNWLKMKNRELINLEKK
jgi:hypothetical protein